MMMPFFNSICSSVWMLWWWLMFVKGENLCKREFLQHFNISTGLQSDVLLQCNFNPALLGSDQTADIAVVWSQNTTLNGLVEITLQGDERFWDYKGGRIKAFPELSKSGNFSILLQNVQPYDLSLYHCELFNGSSCSIAYQEIQLGRDTVFLPVMITGVSAGAVLLCLFIGSLFYISRKRKHQPYPESPRGCPYDNPIYASYTGQFSPEGDGSHNENQIYEIIQSSTC